MYHFTYFELIEMKFLTIQLKNARYFFNAQVIYKLISKSRFLFSIDYCSFMITFLLSKINMENQEFQDKF